MIIELTEKEATELKQKREEMLRLYDEAVRKARALRPGAEYPPDIDADNEDPMRTYEQWLKGGSEEWRFAYERVLRLTTKLISSRYATDTLEKADNRILKNITKSQDKTVESLKKQVRMFLSSDIVCDQEEETGIIKATSEKAMRKELQDLFYKPMQTLDEEHRNQIEEYINLKLESFTPEESRYAIDYTVLPRGRVDDEEIIYTIYGFVKREPQKGRYTTTAPKKYVSLRDRVTKQVFDGEGKAIRPLDADDQAYLNVHLEPRGCSKVILARVAIDYRELIEQGILKEIKDLTADDLDVHDAILTQLYAGNYAFTKLMIYRGMTGKNTGYLEIPEEADQIIEAALLKFKALIHIVYSNEDRDGNLREFKAHEPMVTYIRGEAYLNGNYQDDVIMIPRDERFMPPLYKWALFNGNEIDTRDITLLDVPGLYNSKESRTLKMYLYRRIIEKANDFKRIYHEKKELPNNARSILYERVYEAIGLDPKTITKYKRNDVKTKIDKCMKHWVDKGLITSYEHKRESKAKGNNFCAVWVTFMPQIKEKDKN